MEVIKEYMLLQSSAHATAVAWRWWMGLHVQTIIHATTIFLIHLPLQASQTFR